jgi:hypothetical protein
MDLTSLSVTVPPGLLRVKKDSLLGIMQSSLLMIHTASARMVIAKHRPDTSSCQTEISAKPDVQSISPSPGCSPYSWPSLLTWNLSAHSSLSNSRNYFLMSHSILIVPCTCVSGGEGVIKTSDLAHSIRTIFPSTSTGKQELLIAELRWWEDSVAPHKLHRLLQADQGRVEE